MEEYGGVSEGLTSSEGIKTFIKECTQESGLGGGKQYPERPYEPDCARYMTTGSCSFGPRCRFNHPRERGVTILSCHDKGTRRGGKGQYPERVGQRECQQYMRTGICKLGSTCKYHHPKQGGGSVTQLSLNYLGYPLRPGEKKCSYYMKTGQCKFGATCKFHHPEPAGKQVPALSPISGVASVPAPVPAPPLYPTGQSQSVLFSEHSGFLMPRPPLLPGSYVQGPLGPVLLSPGLFHFPGCSPYTAPVSPLASSNTQATTELRKTQLSPSAPACPVPSPVGSSSSNLKEQDFPERPGEPECIYYMRTGDCKFGSSCRYHHPPDLAAPKTNVTFSPFTHPLHPVPSHVMLGISKHEEAPSTPQRALSLLGEACSRMDLIGIYQILVRMPYKDDGVTEMRDMLETMRHGDHAFCKQDFITAIDCYSQFIYIAMVSPVIFARRSLCYLFCDQPEDALRDAMQAQCVYPEWPIAFYLQSVAFAKLGMHKEAAELLNEAARLEEKSQQDETYEARTVVEETGMIPEASGQQRRKATSQGIKPEIVQIQDMHAQSHPSSALGQNDMPTEISLEATIQNGMVSLSGGRHDIRIDRTLNTIVECIKSSDIGKIGVYGRAGVGKTTVMEALKDLPEIRSMFDHIIWVTIPKTWNPIEVKKLIARQLSFSEIDDKHKETERFVFLLERMKFLLILDDVVEHINLEMVGIPKPIPENGSKIVLTTRSQQVCEIMAADANIRLEDLLSWELFCQSVGEVVDSFNIRPIAKQLVEMCCHYSHAIILMAGTLKYVSDVDVWKNALEWLSRQPASYGENLENLLIDVLKFSCEHLADDTTKKCLRYCAQHYEKEEIAMDSLIQQWIADGLVDTLPEGNRILQNLINANLLESVKGGVFVKLQNIDRHILVNSIIQPEEGKLFLMSGGLGLTEPPKEEEWENAKEIHLMHNELSELPENPRCPMLLALFLQRNYKLRLIPPSFFDYMPALQVLNLSSTRIRSLPESLFRLVSLKRLFLNDCRNFMMLSPKVGELKRLEVLDLEGTEIMNLPREIKNLTGLICLEVSLYGHGNDGRRVKQSDAIVPSGIISALSEVEELNIDVNPDNEQWDACVEVIVNEVCSLMKLSTLKFYFPRVELLSHFEWNNTSMVYPFLSHFRFIVGHHVKRIMTRLPRDVEFELERWDRCLKYVNGVGVPGEIKKVLRHATAFHLDRHTTVEKLTEFGIENMEHLKFCVVGECNELKVIIDAVDFLEEDDSGTGLESLECLYIYYMKNLRSIWEGPLHQRSFTLLKSLTLRTCPQLITIFKQESLYNLRSLEELTVEDCPVIISLVNCENSYCYLPKLKKISVRYLPELASIFNGQLIAPELEWMSFYYCPKLKRLRIEKPFNEKLKKIKGELSWWNALEWNSGRPDYLDDIFVPIDICD